MRNQLLATCALTTLSTAAVPPAPRPNIIFILADDLGYGELGCYGQQKIRTPHLDQLAKEGLRFTQHYSGAPVSAPARCVLLTGRHLGHAEIRGNRQASRSFPNFTEGQHPISQEIPTLAQTLRDAGYETAAVGKWGLGPVGSTGDPNKKGFNSFFGYNCQALAHSYYPAHLWRNNLQISINMPGLPGHRPVKTEGEIHMNDYIGQSYAPDMMMREALGFLERQAKQPAKPFFLYLAFIEPHVAMHPPAKDVDAYPKEWDTQPYRGESGYLPHPRPRAAYAAMISGLDRHVGEVMQALDRHGLTKNTLLVFTSDNGPTHEGKAGSPFHVGGADPVFFNSTAGLKGYKGSVHEGGLRVPAIVRHPGHVPAGVSNNTAGFFADWFPTLCAAAHITPPAGLDGENLWPVITGKDNLAERKPMVWVFPEYGGQVAVRIGNFKVLKQNLSRPKNPQPWQVYDLTNDRGEQHNLAAARPDLVARAAAILKEQTSPNAIFPLAIPAAE